MKTYLIHLILLLNITYIFSQDFTYVDKTVADYPKHFDTPQRLAEQINSDFSTDIDKVRALYTWITHHVDYDIKEKGKFSHSYDTYKDKIKRNELYRRALSIRVVAQGKAVCEGYSILFNETCHALHIKSKVVSGASKTDIKDIGKRYKNNHTWNIVEIDNKKYLIDTTWGAGSYSTTDKFIRHVDYYYFMTDPQQFIKKHYPKDYKDSLLDYLIDKDSFSKAAFTYENYSDNFELIKPNNGYLLRNTSNPIRIKTSHDIKEFYFFLKIKNENKKILVTQLKQSEDEYSFNIDLVGRRARSITLYADDHPIFGFKLAVPKK